MVRLNLKPFAKPSIRTKLFPALIKHGQMITLPKKKKKYHKFNFSHRQGFADFFFSLAVM